MFRGKNLKDPRMLIVVYGSYESAWPKLGHVPSIVTHVACTTSGRIRARVSTCQRVGNRTAVSEWGTQRRHCHNSRPNSITDWIARAILHDDGDRCGHGHWDSYLYVGTFLHWAMSWRKIVNKKKELLIAHKRIASLCSADHAQLCEVRWSYSPVELTPRDASERGGSWFNCFFEVVWCVVWMVVLGELAVGVGVTLWVAVGASHGLKSNLHT